MLDELGIERYTVPLGLAISILPVEKGVGRRARRARRDIGSGRQEPQHLLYFLPLPQGHGSFLPTLSAVRTLGLATASGDGWLSAASVAGDAPIPPCSIPYTPVSR